MKPPPLFDCVDISISAGETAGVGWEWARTYHIDNELCSAHVLQVGQARQ